MSKKFVELAAIPPNTVESMQAEIKSEIERVLQEHGDGNLLVDEQISIDVEETFPIAEVIVVGFTLLSGIALETYKQVILPWLRRRYEIRRESSEDEE